MHLLANMPTNFFKSTLIVVLSIALNSCGEKSNSSVELGSVPLLKELSSESTGVSFSNDVITGNSFNYFNWEYIYNGGGVSVTDFDNDGNLDIYFTGNQVEDKLYRNLGNLKFEDVTPLNINENIDDWRTGVSYADVNADGLMDIYICRSGKT
ncbi:MAG: hypothetical protein ACI85F_002423, partial [Bacteroidia bacterium]